jgi:hypothetical protein
MLELQREQPEVQRDAIRSFEREMMLQRYKTKATRRPNSKLRTAVLTLRYRVAEPHKSPPSRLGMSPERGFAQSFASA